MMTQLQSEQNQVYKVLPSLLHEVAINSSPNRLLLTNVNVMEEIKLKTGALIVCKGKYYSPQNLPMARAPFANENEKPLYLEVRANESEPEVLENAIRMINELRDKSPQETYLEEIYNLDYMTRDFPKGFNVRKKLLGQNKINFKYISKMSAGTKVLLRGRLPTSPAHFLGSETERLHVLLQCPCLLMCGKARRLLDSLCRKVLKFMEKFRRRVDEKRREMEKKVQEMSDSIDDEDKMKDDDAMDDFLTQSKRRMNPYMLGMAHLRKLANKGGVGRLRYEEAQYVPNVSDYEPLMFKKYKTNINSMKESLGEPFVEKQGNSKFEKMEDEEQHLNDRNQSTGSKFLSENFQPISNWKSKFSGKPSNQQYSRNNERSIGNGFNNQNREINLSSEIPPQQIQFQPDFQRQYQQNQVQPPPPRQEQPLQQRLGPSLPPGGTVNQNAITQQQQQQNLMNIYLQQQAYSQYYYQNYYMQQAQRQQMYMNNMNNPQNQQQQNAGYQQQQPNSNINVVGGSQSIENNKREMAKDLFS